VINVTVIYVGVVLGAVMTVSRLGGIQAMTRALPADHPGFDLLAVGPALIAAWFIVMITQAHSTQAVIQIGFASKDERHAAKAYVLGGLLILPVGFISALIGMAAAVLYPEIVATEALPRVVLGLPPLAAGLILAGLWAADVSTASALLMGSATLVSSDIVKRFFAPDLSPGRELLLGRITVAVLSVFTFLLALTIQGILKALLIGLTLTTGYTLIALMTIYAPGLCRRSSAIWTLLATMGSLALWWALPESGRIFAHPIYFTWIASLAAFFLTALLDGRKIS
jgi:SSS family solute:Na+ symporter